MEGKLSDCTVFSLPVSFHSGRRYPGHCFSMAVCTVIRKCSIRIKSSKYQTADLLVHPQGFLLTMQSQSVLNPSEGLSIHSYSSTTSSQEENRKVMLRFQQQFGQSITQQSVHLSSIKDRLIGLCLSLQTARQNFEINPSTSNLGIQEVVKIHNQSVTGTVCYTVIPAQLAHQVPATNLFWSEGGGTSSKLFLQIYLRRCASRTLCFAYC